MKSESNTVLPHIYEKSCGVILYRVEKGMREYLLLHYPGGHWDFPKGHVERRDANEIATAHRELEEETGIKEVAFNPDYRELMYYEFNRGKKELVKKTVVYFLAESKESEEREVELSHEHQNFEWMAFEPSLKRLTFDNARDLLHKAEDQLNAPLHDNK